MGKPTDGEWSEWLACDEHPEPWGRYVQLQVSCLACSAPGPLYEGWYCKDLTKYEKISSGDMELICLLFRSEFTHFRFWKSGLVQRLLTLEKETTDA